MSTIVMLVLGILTQCQLELGSSLRILGVSPHVFRSHFAMTDSLMKELARRGHQVDVISRFPQANTVPNYTDIVVGSKEGVLVGNGTYTFLQNFVGSTAVRSSAMLAGLNTCALLGHPNLQLLLKNKKGHYDVIVVELFIAHCFLAMGRHLDAPVVGLVTMKLLDWLSQPLATPLSPSYVPSIFSEYSQHMSFWQRLRNTLLTTYTTYMMNYCMEFQAQQVEKYLGQKLSSMSDLYHDVSLVLVNQHHSVTDIRPLTPNIIEVGGLHVEANHQQMTRDLQKWLNESTDGCVYFSFGSIVQIETFPERLMTIFYEMFKRIAPVRILIKIAKPALLPPGLPENVRTAPWLPQPAVLRHKNVKLFITHGGLMGIYEAVAYKVPMVGLPFGVDQHTMIRSCAEKKIAIALSLDETLTAESLISAVRTVLTDPTYKNNVERVSKLFWDRPMSAIDTAVYWVEYTARHGKLLESPAAKLTWWQLYLLDVYSFMLLSVFILLYAAKKIGVFLDRLLRSRGQGNSSTEELSVSKKNW